MIAPAATGTIATHLKNYEVSIMSTINNNTLGQLRLFDIPYQDATAVIEWLRTQPDFVGEAVAKQCYQLITNTKH